MNTLDEYNLSKLISENSNHQIKLHNDFIIKKDIIDRLSKK
jgi:hypothetical protein